MDKAHQVRHDGTNAACGEVEQSERQLRAASDVDVPAHEDLARQAHVDPVLAMIDDAPPSAAASVGRPRKASEWLLFVDEAARHRLLLNSATRTFAADVNRAKQSLLFADDGSQGATPEVRCVQRDELLQWWRDRRQKLSILFSIFRRYCAMPAGGGPSDSQFSTMGHLL